MHANFIIKMYNSLADFRLTRIGFSPIQKNWSFAQDDNETDGNDGDDNDEVDDDDDEEDDDDDIDDNGDDLRGNHGMNGEKTMTTTLTTPMQCNASPTPLQREIHNFPPFLRIKKIVSFAANNRPLQKEVAKWYQLEMTISSEQTDQ